jgi:hypothetical protein
VTSPFWSTSDPPCARRHAGDRGDQLDGEGRAAEVFGRTSLDRSIVSGLIDLFSNMPFEGSRADFDLIGKVYEYFIGEFVSNESAAASSTRRSRWLRSSSRCSSPGAGGCTTPAMAPARHVRPVGPLHRGA